MQSRYRFHSVLFGASLLMSLASGMVNYALIFYVRDLFSADKAAVGLISSALTLLYFMGIIVFLSWKKPHPRFVLWFATWVMALCIGVYLIIPDWKVTFIFHGLFGLAMALFWPRIMGWLSWGVEGKDLGRTMGRFNFSWAFGGILSPYLGGLLVEIDLRLPFIVAMILLAATGLLMPIGAKLFPGFKDRHQPTPAEAVSDSGDEATRARATAAASTQLTEPTRLRYPARLAGVNAYFLTGALLFIFPAFAKDSLGFSESLIGLFLLVRMAAATLGFEIWGRWTFWHFRFWPLAAATAVLICLALVFPAGSHAWQFYVLFASVGLIFSFLYSYALFHGVAGSLHRERSMTIHEAALNIGLFSGTLLCGWVSETWSMNIMFILCAAVSTFLLLAQVALRVAWKRVHP